MLCPLCHTEHSTSGCPQTGLGCITGGIKFPESIIKELPSRLEIAARVFAYQKLGHAIDCHDWKPNEKDMIEWGKTSLMMADALIKAYRDSGGEEPK